MVPLIFFLLASFMGSPPATKPASRPVATRPAVHVLTAREKARIAEIGKQTATLNAEIRKEQKNIASERRAGPYGSGAAQVASQRRIEELKAEQARLQDELTRIRRGFWTGPPPEPIPPLNVERLAVGQVGQPHHSGIMHAWGREYQIPKNLFRVRQVVGPNDYILDRGNGIWVTGEPTAGMVDGAERKLIGAYRVAGTKTYETAGGGTKTVFVLTPDTRPAK